MRNSSFPLSKQRPWLNDEERGEPRLRSTFAKSAILAFIISTFGCSSITELTKDGIGQLISTVIERYGPPSRVTPDGMGGSTYIWERWVATDYGGGHLWTTTYWADSKGIIYKWR